MSQYGDSQNVFEDSHVEHVGTEDFLDAEEVPAAISQRTEFFVLSPQERELLDFLFPSPAGRGSTTSKTLLQLLLVGAPK